MAQLTHRLTLSGGAIAFLLLFFFLPPFVHAEPDSALTKQVITKLDYFEKLLHSKSADQLLAANQGAALNKAKALFSQAKSSLDAGDPKEADKLIRQGFSTFTDAVKKIAKRRKAATATVETKKERYLKLHKTVNDLYLRLNAMNKSAKIKQRNALDTIARNLSNAEQFAAKGQYHQALDELIDAQNTISTVLPNTRKPSAATITTKRPEKSVPPPAPSPLQKPAKLRKIGAEKKAPVKVKKTAPVKPNKKKPPPRRVVKRDTRTTLQKYSAELRLFQRYEALIQPTLEREGLADHEGMRLLKTTDETRLKADRARGKAIDGNYSSALQLMKQATKELKQALVKAGAKL